MWAPRALGCHWSIAADVPEIFDPRDWHAHWRTGGCEALRPARIASSAKTCSEMRVSRTDVAQADGIRLEKAGTKNRLAIRVLLLAANWCVATRRGAMATNEGSAPSVHTPPKRGISRVPPRRSFPNPPFLPSSFFLFPLFPSLFLVLKSS